MALLCAYRVSGVQAGSSTWAAWYNGQAKRGPDSWATPSTVQSDGRAKRGHGVESEGLRLLLVYCSSACTYHGSVRGLVSRGIDDWCPCDAVCEDRCSWWKLSGCYSCASLPSPLLPEGGIVTVRDLRERDSCLAMPSSQHTTAGRWGHRWRLWLSRDGSMRQAIVFEQPSTSAGIGVRPLSKPRSRYQNHGNARPPTQGII